MYNLTIKVTKDILKKSKFCKSDEHVGYNCAVALAVRDIFPDANVGMYGIFLPKISTVEAVIKLPVKASAWIQLFDDTSPGGREKLNEFLFDVELSDEVIETIDIQDIKKILENHPTLELSEK